MDSKKAEMLAVAKVEPTVELMVEQMAAQLVVEKVVPLVVRKAEMTAGWMVGLWEN